MAKLHSETLAGVGLLDASSPTPPLGGDEHSPGAPLSSLVGTHRAGEAPSDGEVAQTTAGATLSSHTQPGLGVQAPAGAYGSNSVQRSGTHVRVSTQNGSSVRPGVPAEAAGSVDQVRRTPVPSVAPAAPSEALASEARASEARASAAPTVDQPHDTLRGVGSSETSHFSQTLPFMAMPKRMEVSLGAPVDIDVFTSAPSGTLPVGTRLPRALIDAARAEHAQPARLRGFATIPPVTPKVLMLKNDVVSVAEADASGADRASLRAPFDAPKFDQTLAFGTTPNPYGAGGAGAAREALGTTPSPITPRAKRPLPAASSEANTDVPRVPSSTLMSERMAPESALLDTTPSTGTRPVALQRATEETFRPSAHTTPPGLPEVRKLPNYVWAVAVLPVAALVALATFKFEGTSAAQGAVVLEGGTTPVVTRVAGPVVQVLVKPGDSLTAGQAVAEIDPSTLDQRREELKARETALLAERERVTTLGAKWHSAATDALQRKRGVLWQRLALRNGDGTGGSASKERSSSDRDALLLIRQELADVEFELNRRESDRDDQQRTWEHRMNEVRAELAQVNDSSTSVRAPVSGRVEALLATPGQVLTAGSPIARLIPDGAEKQIVVLVPTRLSETLNVGTELPLTLPLDQATTLPARVTHIADGNVTREEAASLLSAPQLEPLVRVEVELVDPDSAPNLASALRPGQRVSALVPDEKRSLWRHLVSKFE